MKNTSRSGNAFELVVAKALEHQGFVVASRRHVGGAGDLLAVHPDGRIWAVECKNRKGNVYVGFTRDQRREMRDLPLPPHAERYLAFKDGHLIQWRRSDTWPSNGD